jgi:3-oxoacyl-[acyl-carrier protein] reductase
MRYRGKVVVITGAAAGLGRAYALGFSSEGAHVVCTDIDETGLLETVRLVVASGGSAEAHAFDVADADAVGRFAAGLGKRHPGVALLLNNAAIAYGLVIDRSALPHLTQEEWLRFLTVNTVAPVTLANALRPLLKAGNGSVINQSSMASSDPNTAYGVTKAALNAMTRMLAVVFAVDGIRVNGLAPGLIETEASRAGLAQEHIANVKRGQLIQRSGLAENVVALALFLGSEDAAFITSEVIYCDGGSSRRHWRY